MSAMRSRLVAESRFPVGSSASSSLGWTHRCAGHGYALLLAAGQLLRVSTGVVAQSRTVQQSDRPLPPSPGRHTPVPQR